MVKKTSHNPSAFYTFDPIDQTRFELVLKSLEELRLGRDEIWKKMLITNHEIGRILQQEGFESVSERKEIPWDDVTILWLFSSTINSEGMIGEPLDKGKGREQIGRFQFYDGSAINYLLHFLIEESDVKEPRIISHLKKLHCRLTSEYIGHDEYSKGFGGLTLRGYLNQDEVQNLINYLQKDHWSVSANETLDGGVRDIVKHLMRILRTAAHRRVGILQREHS